MSHHLSHFKYPRVSVMSQAAAFADTSIAAPDNTAAAMAPPSLSHIGYLSEDIVNSNILPLLIGSPKDAFNFLLLSRSFHSAGVSSPVLCRVLLTARWPSLARYLAQNPTQAVSIYRQRVKGLPLVLENDYFNDGKFSLNDLSAFLDVREYGLCIFSGDMMKPDRWFNGNELRKFHAIKCNKISQYVKSLSSELGPVNEVEDVDHEDAYDYSDDDLQLEAWELPGLKIEMFLRRSDGAEISFETFYGGTLSYDDGGNPAAATYNLDLEFDDPDISLYFSTLKNQERRATVTLWLKQYDGCWNSQEPKTAARLCSAVDSLFLKHASRHKLRRLK
jgi:hypothetical protein